MKPILCLVLAVMLLITGCTAMKYKEGETMTDNHNENIVDNNSDGVITPMSTEEMIFKLSKLDKSTTMKEVISIFGKSPRIIIETNVDRWEYYSGDITIYLTGINSFDGTLFQVVIAYGDSSFELLLNDSLTLS